MMEVPSISFRNKLMGAAAAAVLVCAFAGDAAARGVLQKTGTVTTTYSFTGGSDGADPWVEQVLGDHGEIYGGTGEGGGVACSASSSGCGTVYRIDQDGTFTSLHQFTGPDGWAVGVVSYGQSELIGGAQAGGAYNKGTLFALNADGSDFRVLHSFTGKDGSEPNGTMIHEGRGAIGIAGFGGFGYKGSHEGSGTLFAIGVDGQFKVLHYFKGGADGKSPNWLVADAQGNVFGSTFSGGASNSGTIFEYSPSTKAYRVIYALNGATDGLTPMVGAVGADGTIYGATTSSKTYPNGTLFALTPGPDGYVFSTIVKLDTVHGDSPFGPPALMGTDTLVGATDNFIYTFRDNQLRLLQEFTKTVPNPNYLPFTEPLAPLTASRTDVVYGTASGAEGQTCAVPNLTNGCGVVFTFKP